VKRGNEGKALQFTKDRYARGREQSSFSY